MISFGLELPGRIVFGAGSLRRLCETLPAGARRVLVVAGSGWYESSGCGAEVAGLLDGFEVGRITCARGEPTAETVERARSDASRFSPDVIVGIGGGSVLDTAKALSALLTLRACVEEYLEGAAAKSEITGAGIPWVAVPTTAGTGAEATKNAVIKSYVQSAKRSMRSRHLLASCILVDPELALGTPPGVSGAAGLDALTQLVEAYTSRKTNTPVRALVRDAFPIMMEALEKIPERPADPQARCGAAYGALVSGIALANAGLGAAHGFAAGIGGSADIPHGLICAVLLPHVLEYNSAVIADSLRELTGVRAGKGDPVEQLSASVRALLRAYGLPSDLKEYAIPRERMPVLIKASAGSSMSGNPRDMDEASAERLLLKVL